MIFVTGFILMLTGSFAAEQFDTTDSLQRGLSKVCSLFAILGFVMMAISVLMFLSKWLP